MGTTLFPAGSPDVLYLVDLSGYVFRAYHAIAPLNAPSGEPTHAVFGTVNMLERLVRERQPALFAVAMDSRTPTFRKQLYPAYKANRPPPPEDLKQQMRRVGEVIDAFPIPIFQHDGVEADDVIATVVDRCRKASIRVVIVSADKDLMQLVSDDVLLWDTMRDRAIGPEEVEARFGVRADQVRDALALMGDSSDNVPGVPSVGPKTARDLLQQFGTLEAIFEHLDEVPKKKLRETLGENREQALLSQRLVTLKGDVAIDFDPDQLHFARRDSQRLRELYRVLGFTRQLEQLDALPSAGDRAPARASDEQRELLLVDSEQALDSVLHRAKEEGRLAIVPCWLGNSPTQGTLVGLGLASNAQRAGYLPFAHRYVGAPRQLACEATLKQLQELCEGVELVSHDLRTLLVLWSQVGAPGDSSGGDTMLWSYLLDPDENHGLEALAARELGIELAPVDSLTRQKGARTRLGLDEVSVEDARDAIAQRAAIVFELAPRLQKKLEEANLWSLWQDLERPLVTLLAELEQRGILLDCDLLARLSEQVATELVGLEAKAHDVAGKTFNVNSPRQLETLLFDELGLKPIKRTKTSRSTDAATLEALAEQHELPGVILEIRKLSKLKGTYLDALPTLVNPRTGRIHTRWHQEVAATGRLSSSDPNLQNIPIRSELGRNIRAAFVAPPGHVLISADYSQIELRVLAHLSKDPVLLDAFQRGQDIHQRTAMEIFGSSEGEVTSEQRRRAKAVNFGVIYGQGDSALGKSLGISRAEAGAFISTYFERYGGVRAFMDATLEVARSSHAVHTLLGRRRLIADINDRNRARRLAAERVAMNTPIQGTAADLLKLAMLRLREPVTPGTRMLLTVHDELVFECPKDEAEAAMTRIADEMQQVMTLDVPLIVDVGSGANWREAH
jgi:DNA polymerase-1